MTMNRNQYPCVEFDLDKLAANLAALVERCHDSLIEVAGVVKAVSSLPEIVRVYEESGVKFIATSRTSQMRAIREAGICKKPLMLIRIPMLSELPDVVELCDISLQSDIIVLRALNEEAKKQGKVHEVILMMDLGDLREGFWNEEDALDAALEIEHELKNLRLAGVGVNLSCYGSVLPTKRNMQGLVSLASDIEREIGRKLDYISGGASTSAYMAMNGTMPYRINLLRLGDIGLRGETDNFAPDFLANLAAGVPVGLGTDVGCPYITHYDMWRELHYFVKYCGVTPAFALYSATKLNARLAGIGDLTGSIEADKQADLIVCSGNPLQNLSALRELDMVVKGGYRIDKPQIKKMDEVERELDKFL